VNDPAKSAAGRQFRRGTGPAASGGYDNLINEINILIVKKRVARRSHS
jgi:hypothetical protein